MNRVSSILLAEISKIITHVSTQNFKIQLRLEVKAEATCKRWGSTQKCYLGLWAIRFHVQPLQGLGIGDVTSVYWTCPIYFPFM